MPTVRAFGAELTELIEFENYMQRYIILNKRAALATLGYGTCKIPLDRATQGPESIQRFSHSLSL
jgi:hypothetical protein